MESFYSACEVKETSLTLSALTQGIGSEIDLVPLVVEPEDLVAMFLQPEIVKTGRIDTKKLEHLALCEQRPQIHDAGKAVLPDDLDDTEYDRLRTMHCDCVSHLSLRLPQFFNRSPRVHQPLLVPGSP